MNDEIPIKRLSRSRRVGHLFLLRQYSQHNPGKILLAKRHASANRPLHKIKSLTSKVKFCPCCNLPEETEGIIEKFKYWDSIEKFAECGIGTYLYFFYFQYAIVILTIALFMSSILTIIINEHYTKGINNICNEYFLEYNSDTLNCKKYISISKGIGFYDNETDWILRFSSDNLKNYRQIYKDFTKNDEVDNVLVNYTLLHFFTLITLFVVNLVYLVIVNAKRDQVDMRHITPHNYTLLCTNLNNTVDSFNKYKNFFSNNEEIKDKSELDKFIYFLKNYVLPNRNETLNIDQINICYKLNEFMVIQDKINDIDEQIFQIQHHPKQIKLNDNEENQKKLENMSYYSGILCCKKKTEYLKLTTEKRKYEKKLETILKEKMVTSKENFAGSILITFKTIKEKENFYKQFPHSFLEKCFVFIKNLKYRICCYCMSEERLERFHRRKKIQISLAPEPEDIIWENMEFTFISKIKRSLIIWSISLLLMGISFGIVYYLNSLQENSEENEWDINTFMKYGISIVISGVIAGINFAFFTILDYFTQLEHQATKTNYYLSYSIKLTIFTFINSALIPLLTNNSQNDGWNDDNDNLINNILFIFLINSTLTPLMWTFNIGYIIKKIRIYLIERQSNPNTRHHLSQKELNELYELPPMDISAKYSYIAKTLLMTFLYIPIFPLGVPISLFGFLLGYFLERYNFTHIYKRPEMINESICIFYISSFNIYLFCFSIGIWMFMNETFHTKVWAFIDIILFGVLCIVPYKQILGCKFLKITESDINTETYEDMYFRFYNDYERTNPMTKKNGLKNYLFKLKSKGKITKETYDIAIDNIEHLNLMQMYYNNIKNNFLPTNTIYNNIDDNKFDDSSQFNFDEYFENYSKNKNQDKNLKMSKYDYQILQAFGKELIEKKDSKMKKSVTNKIDEIENKHFVKNYYNPFFRTIGNIIYENSENGKNYKENSFENEMNRLNYNFIDIDNENNIENNNDDDNDDDNENKNIISLENNDNNKIDNQKNNNNSNSNSNSNNNNPNIIINDINDMNNSGSKKSSNRTIYSVQGEPKIKQILKHETPILIKDSYSKQN